MNLVKNANFQLRFRINISLILLCISIEPCNCILQAYFLRKIELKWIPKWIFENKITAEGFMIIWNKVNGVQGLQKASSRSKELFLINSWWIIRDQIVNLRSEYVEQNPLTSP